MGRYITNINSYQDNELLLLRQGIAKNRKEFLTAGTNTWTIDHDVIARVRVWGGGGGGGGSVNRMINAIQVYAPGAGGGAGGAAEVILRLGAGTYNITVGAGGTGGAAGTGNGLAGESSKPGGTGGTGGSSSFHTYITCSGGLGGTGGSEDIAISGGVGGTVLFDWSGFDGLLYAESRFGGVGGSIKIGSYVEPVSSGVLCATYSGSEGGAGESGGPAQYAWPFFPSGDYYKGGGGGGYNPPFIYGTNMSTQVNSGRGVGAGGAGAEVSSRRGYTGNSGAVVIEWN